MRYRQDQVIELGYNQAIYIDEIYNKNVSIIKVRHCEDGDYLVGYEVIAYKDLKRYIHKMKGRYV